MWPAAEEGTEPARELSIEPPIELPVEINARVVEWMRRFQSDQRASFERFLSRGTVYSTMIRGKLEERGMPAELLYLAMMESGFVTDAMSPRSAVGMWQFMGSTAREYGLRVDRWVDERRDPVTATDAALDYLQWLYDRYGSWYLAAAAYNAGYPRVDRALRGHSDGREGEEALYWEIIDHLPSETREYVPRILAATMLASYADAYGFEVETRGPYEFDRVWVPGGTSLAKVAGALGLRSRVLRDLNPHLLQGMAPPGDAFALRVPVGTASQVVASLDRPGSGFAD
jgi:membrane-bound lytic murein transglycosylase D